MRCLRCNGTMVEVILFTNEGRTPMARCLNCGDRLDNVVMLNRQMSLPKGKKVPPSPVCASSA
jgi:hypothetical protein